MISCTFSSSRLLRRLVVAIVAALFNNGRCIVAADATTADANADTHFVPNVNWESKSIIISDGHGDSDNGARRQLQDNRGDWNIKYVFINMDISVTSTDELMIDYEIGKDRAFAAELFAKDCVDNITGSGIIIGPSSIRTNKNATTDFLTVGYSVDKSQISQSNIWNSATGQIQFCHVMQLIEPAVTDSTPLYVIAQDTTEFDVDVDLSVDYTLNQTLGRNGPRLRMTGRGNVTVGNVNRPLSPRDRLTFERTVREAARGALAVGQEVDNATVLNVNEGDYVPERALRDAKNDGLGLDQQLQQGGQRKLQTNNTIIEFELVLEEECENATACEELKTSSTMYESVTTHMMEQIENGDFTDALRANAAEDSAGRYLTEYDDNSRNVHHRKLTMVNATVTGGEFSDPVVEIILPETNIVIGNSTGFTDVISYIQACKCDGAQSFTCSTSDNTLFPNDELFVCIKSVSPEVEVDFLDSMFVTQGGTSLSFIQNNRIQSPSFTSREYVPGMNVVAVSTRVPSNLFTYGAGEFITISGAVVMKLAGGERRKLVIVASDAKVDENSSFQLQVDLAQEMTSIIKEVPISSAAVGEKGYALSGVVIFSYACSMFW